MIICEEIQVTHAHVCKGMSYSAVALIKMSKYSMSFLMVTEVHFHYNCSWKQIL
jgi:hypothetical protein